LRRNYRIVANGKRVVESLEKKERGDSGKIYEARGNGRARDGGDGCKNSKLVLGDQTVVGLLKRGWRGKGV